MERVGSYDVTLTVADSAKAGRNFIFDIRVSGDDYEASRTYEGETTPHARFKQVGGVGYIHDGNAWRRSERPLDDVSLLYPGISTSVACPETTAFRHRGKETLNGAEVNHYADSTAQSGAANSVGITLTTSSTELWIDKGGQIVKHARTVDRVDNTKTPAVSSTIQMLSVFSGIGGANVITAPVIR